MSLSAGLGARMGARPRRSVPVLFCSVLEFGPVPLLFTSLHFTSLHTVKDQHGQTGTDRAREHKDPAAHGSVPVDFVKRTVRHGGVKPTVKKYNTEYSNTESC